MDTMSITINYETESLSSEEEMEMPSQVTHYKWLRTYNGDFRGEKFPNAGRWILFCDRDIQDEIWRLIKDLVESQETKIYLGVASTQHEKNLKQYANGAICCLTRDYTNDSEVKEIGYQIKDCLETSCRFPFTSTMKYKRGGIIDDDKDLDISAAGKCLYELTIKIGEDFISIKEKGL